MTTYVRKNAWNNDGTFSNSDLYWYAKGVGVLMSRSLDDPTSWWFFAAIHGQYITDAAVGPKPKPEGYPNWAQIQGPPNVPVAPLPRVPVQALYWDQCQHGSWYFLPWHRGYLLMLENHLRAAIIDLGGPADWALPYWNYFGGLNGSQYSIPPAFMQEELDGETNPLYVAMRYGPNGDNDVYMPTDAGVAAHPGGYDSEGVVTQDCLQTRTYTSTTTPGFGGPETTFSHSGRTFGTMESNPHNIGHDYIGGDTVTPAGIMTDPGTAGLDPIFYLHHANVDRMWSLWNAMGNTNPTDPEWLSGPSIRPFVMPGTDGKPWFYTPEEMNTTDELGYSYQELDAPTAPRHPLLVRLDRLNAIDAIPTAKKLLQQPRKARRSELLGASAKGVAVNGANAANIPVHVDSDVQQKVEKSIAQASASAMPDRVFLKLEGVKGVHDAGILRVFLDLPDGATAEQAKEARVGTIGLFGLRGASDPHGAHGGAGLNFVLDVSDYFDRHHLSGAGPLESVRVTVQPARTLPEGSSITIRRAALYREHA